MRRKHANDNGFEFLKLVPWNRTLFNLQLGGEKTTQRVALVNRKSANDAARIRDTFDPFSLAGRQPHSNPPFHGAITIESSASTGISSIVIRRSQPVIENIVKVCPKGGVDSLAESKVFVQTEIHSPGTGSPQQVSFGDLGIIKHVSAHWWKSKRCRIVELISNMVLVVPNDHRPVAPLKVSNSIHRACGDISWANVVVTVETIIARSEER